MRLFLFNLMEKNLFSKKILPTLAQCEDVKDRLYDVKDKALLMADYETIGQTAEFLKTLHAELEDQFSSLLRYACNKCQRVRKHKTHRFFLYWCYIYMEGSLKLTMTQRRHTELKI